MFPGTCVDMGWGDETGDQSRVRIHKSRKQRAGVEVSTDPRGEASGCLHYFMLLTGPGNPGPQTAMQRQKEWKRASFEKELI